MKKIFYFAFIFLTFSACDPSIKKDATVIPINQNSEHIVLGNPSNARIDLLVPNNYLIIRNEYATSYNNSKGHANWTAWNLTKAWLGSTQRQDDFRTDNDLPEGFLKVSNTDYNSSGFDRGHLCPSGDRTNSVQSNSMTFLMTNMIPQAPENNQKTWNALEDYTRALVDNNTMECHIFAGAYGTGGVGSANNNLVSAIAGGKINVPARTWKIIVVMPLGTNDLTRVTNTTRVIAVDMPNTQSIITGTNAWKSYRVSVKTLEQRTGFNFLSNVPQDIQDVIENVVDNL